MIIGFDGMCAGLGKAARFFCGHCVPFWVRNADKGEMGFFHAEAVVDGRQAAEQLCLNAGDLLLFRGRNSLHRVTPVEDDSTRQLAVLAYNSQPGISLSETAQMTFFGRTSGPILAV